MYIEPYPEKVCEEFITWKQLAQDFVIKNNLFILPSQYYREKERTRYSRRKTERRKYFYVVRWHLYKAPSLQHPNLCPLFNEGLVNARNWDNHIIQDISWAWSGFLAFKQQGPTAMSYQNLGAYRFFQFYGLLLFICVKLERG